MPFVIFFSPSLLRMSAVKFFSSALSAPALLPLLLLPAFISHFISIRLSLSSSPLCCPHLPLFALLISPPFAFSSLSDPSLHQPPTPLHLTSPHSSPPHPPSLEQSVTVMSAKKTQSVSLNQTDELGAEQGAERSAHTDTHANSGACAHTHTHTFLHLCLQG